MSEGRERFGRRLGRNTPRFHPAGSAHAGGELTPEVEHVVTPIDDVRASASYRRTVSGLLLERLALSAPPE
ncbi:MAG: hypothetical protein WCP98_08920 [Actinomycetes bacterium]